MVGGPPGRIFCSKIGTFFIAGKEKHEAQVTLSCNSAVRCCSGYAPGMYFFFPLPAMFSLGVVFGGGFILRKGRMNSGKQIRGLRRNFVQSLLRTPKASRVLPILVSFISSARPYYICLDESKAGLGNLHREGPHRPAVYFGKFNQTGKTFLPPPFPCHPQCLLKIET